ncbi:MAG: hypothetical protein ACJA1A_003511 [Saprospiraceae bacterium]|jgi:hypothetical protein|tara:strand:- start:1191 stop:1388 length:198 start_codon:yes stop_codon:yes gene_type:complete
MKKKGRNHFIWIIAIAASWLIFEYFYYGIISTSNVVKAIAMAVVLEFGQYCRDVYINDNEEPETN